jgi:chitinase
MAAGGDSLAPYTTDPEVYAADCCNWANFYNLDGVEFDLENIYPGFTYPGVPDLYAWMKTMNSTARSILGPNKYLSHAPQAPYLAAPGHPDAWCGIRGGYSQCLLDEPSIDYLCVQIYNQGDDAYPTYDSYYLSNTKFPYSAQSQIYNNGAGIPYYKQVLGLTMQPEDGSSGYHDPLTASSWLTQAQSDFKVPRNSMCWQLNENPIPLQWIHTMYPEITGPAALVLPYKPRSGPQKKSKTQQRQKRRQKKR